MFANRSGGSSEIADDVRSQPIRGRFQLRCGRFRADCGHEGTEGITDARLYDAPRRRGASVATATINSSGSIGFTRCI